MSKNEESQIEELIQKYSTRLSETKRLEQGDVVVRLTDKVEREIRVGTSDKGFRLQKEAMQSPPRIEVIGDSKRILAILRGDKDARKQFLAGGIRVRGDLRYLSDLAMELGILDEPL
jgi:putative sterol carrier protein